MNSSFEIATSHPETIADGFQKQGFAVTQLTPDCLKLTGNDWNDVIVHVKKTEPGMPGYGVVTVGTNEGEPPFGYLTRGLDAANA